jgi:hypothetical protein
MHYLLLFSAYLTQLNQIRVDNNVAHERRQTIQAETAVQKLMQHNINKQESFLDY